MAALMTIMEAAQLAEEPAARNSKRFPVKAKGEVRLRSVLSCKMAGIRLIPNCNAFFSSGVSLASLRRATTSSNMWDKWRPKKMDRMAGGASLAPKRWLLPALTMEARSKSWFLYTIISTLTIKVRNNIFPSAVFAGENKLMPVSVQSDQLLCLPEPLTPLNGFS